MTYNNIVLTMPIRSVGIAAMLWAYRCELVLINKLINMFILVIYCAKKRW